MSEKRKDSKGRILRTGESQRKDGSYQYRYLDNRKERRTVYASTLQELREKEKNATKESAEGVSYSKAEITVYELLERHIGLKRNIKTATKSTYTTVLNRLRKDPMGARQIKTVKQSGVKKWVIELYEEGLSYGTINIYVGKIKAAFKVAIDDDILTKNPFNLQCRDVIPNKTMRRNALTDTQQTSLLDYVRHHKIFSKAYDVMVILLGTGLRISELAGLTKNDINFKERKICVDHQYLIDIHGRGYISPPKSEAGVREIPMEDDVYNSLLNVLAKRPQLKVEQMIDGYSNFIFLNRTGRIKDAVDFDHMFNTIKNRYNESHDDKIQKLTPHILRHTFCTNKHNAGLDVKSLQYLMGHSTVSMTMDRYTHSDYDSVKKALENLKSGT